VIWGNWHSPLSRRLNRGEKLSEIIKQPQYQPLPVEKQVAILVAATTGKLDDIPTSKVKEFEIGLYRFLETERPQLLADLAASKALSDEISSGLNEAIDTFRQSFLA
jgi:F-type H+/Na+-transporting ATPase subunit alpha